MAYRKPTKFAKLYGIDVDFEQELTDQEVRLFHLYLRLVDWDSRHQGKFGSVKLTIREIRKFYLPIWSVGKISTTTRSLITKRWLERAEEGRIGIRNFIFYTFRPVQFAEKGIRLTRQGVLETEHGVQKVESYTALGFKIWAERNARNPNKFKDFAQMVEQASSSKDTLKIFKEDIKTTSFKEREG